MRGYLDMFYEKLDACYMQQNPQKTEQLLLESIRSAQDEQIGDSEKIALYNELGSFYRGVSRYAQSLAAFEQARILAEHKLGTACSQYATILNNMAGVYRLIGAYDKAISLFRQAIDIYCRNGLQNSYAYASVLNNLALAYRESGAVQEAIECLREALVQMEAQPQQVQETAITYNNLTALYRLAGDQEKAMSCLRRALQLFEQCDERENVHYAAGLNSLAAVLYEQQEYEQAIAIYQKSVKYTLRFFGQNVEYAQTYQNMAYVYERMGKEQAAISALLQAKAVYDRLFGTTHMRTRTVTEEIKRLQRMVSCERSGTCAEIL